MIIAEKYLLSSKAREALLKQSRRQAQTSLLFFFFPFSASQCIKQMPEEHFCCNHLLSPHTSLLSPWGSCRPPPPLLSLILNYFLPASLVPCPCDVIISSCLLLKLPSSPLPGTCNKPCTLLKEIKKTARKLVF